VARFIESLHVRDFRCCKDVRFELTDLHAFVGPNDSGKSTLLEAIQKASQPHGKELPRDWEMTLPGGFLVSRGKLRVPSEPTPLPLSHAGVMKLRTQQPGIRLPELIAASPSSTPLVRLDPDQLRAPAALLEGKPSDAWFSTDRGAGLPAVYDVLLSQNRAAFDALEASCRSFYPTVANLVLENQGSQKLLGVRLVDGTRVLATHMSEGMLFFLAYAAMQHLRPAPVLLIEEPETGLHPSRIADVVRVLREIAKDRQVVLATHSPLVVNELTPEEVSVVTRDPITGTRVTRLRDTPNFEQRASVYALGELWLAYANGADEAPLLRPVAGESTP